MENDFILPLEKEVFIEQLKDIVDKAEDMLSEDTEGERTSDQGCNLKHTEGAGAVGPEVRRKLSTPHGISRVICPQVLQLGDSLHPDSTLILTLHADPAKKCPVLLMQHFNLTEFISFSLVAAWEKPFKVSNKLIHMQSL